MLQVERKVLNFIYKHMLAIVFAVAMLFSLYIRFQLRGFLSGDMDLFLLQWVESVREIGVVETLRLPMCDYNVAYLFLLKLASMLPFNDIVNVKLISILFDYLAAGATVWLVLLLLPETHKNRKQKALAIGSIMILLPTVIANSAVWGQCDSIYTFFLLVCTIFLLKEKYTAAFFLYSFAIVFKLQAIFYLPVLVVLYFVQKKFSILQFLQIPFWTIVIGLFGRQKGDSLLYGLELYVEQTGRYKEAYKNYPNFWYLLMDADYEIFAPVGIAAVAVVLVCFMGYVVYKKWNPQPEQILLLIGWSILTCTHFFPAMHERYAYAAEWMLLVYFLIKPSIKRFGMIAPIYFIAMLIYLRAFFEKNFITQEQMSLINMAGYALVTVVLLLEIHRNSQKEQLG